MRKFFLTCTIGFVFIGTPISANAQVAKVITKGVTKGAKAISKTASKSGTKTATKGATAAGATTKASTSKGATTSGSKYASEVEKTKTVRPVTYTCSTCNGSGKVTSWNSYFGHNITSKCSNCHGKGKITKIIRF